MSRIFPYRVSAYSLPPVDDSNLPYQVEETGNLRDYWIVILKYRRMIVAFLLSIALIAAISLWWSVPLYTATTTLHLENRSPNIVGAPEAFTLIGGGLDQYYQTQLNLLKSRSLAARVIQDLDLAQDPRFQTYGEGLLDSVRSYVRQGAKSVATGSKR